MTNFNDPAISPDSIPSATAIHEAGHAVIGALLGVPPLLVSIEEGEFEYGRADFPALCLGDLWPEDVDDVALIRRHLVIGWAGHCATRAILGAADDVDLGIVPSASVPTWRLATRDGDLGRILHLADFATHRDRVHTGVLVDEAEVFADLLVAERRVKEAILSVAGTLDLVTLLRTDEVCWLIADLLQEPLDLALDLIEPEEVRMGVTEVVPAGFLELPDPVARELFFRSINRLSDRYNDAFLPDFEDDGTLTEMARMVAALVNHWIGDYPEEVI